jgi:hypothetical protein
MPIAMCMLVIDLRGTDPCTKAFRRTKIDEEDRLSRSGEATRSCQRQLINTAKLALASIRAFEGAKVWVARILRARQRSERSRRLIGASNRHREGLAGTKRAIAPKPRWMG